MTDFIGGGVPGFPLTRPGVSIAAADLFEELEMKAAWAPRNGKRAVVGLAALAVSILSSRPCFWHGRKNSPRSARALADRVVANIVMWSEKRRTQM